jgi:SAM-dependent methyltransferase
MLKKIFFVIKSQGVKSVLSFIRQRIYPLRAKSFQLCNQLTTNKIGLEIGGPSGIFKQTGILPIYKTVKQLDNCNFAGLTTWEGEIKEGLTFQFKKDGLPGRQYLSEAADLSAINSAKFDFILSSHMLEHAANPLKALSEWSRVLKDGGNMVVVVPHKDGTFDHKRPVTTLEHLIEDFRNETQEDDLTHLSEILKLHDLTQDPGAGTLQAFEERSLKNFENRCLHHHAFDTNLIIQVFNYKQLQIRTVETILPYHIIIVAQKVSNVLSINNKAFLEDDAEYRNLSPFASDKL